MGLLVDPFAICFAVFYRKVHKFKIWTSDTSSRLGMGAGAIKIIHQGIIILKRHF